MRRRPLEVVGVYGVGKDTLMQAAAPAGPAMELAHRAITRSTEAGRIVLLIGPGATIHADSGARSIS